jgi:hypothetical protein
LLRNLFSHDLATGTTTARVAGCFAAPVAATATEKPTTQQAAATTAAGIASSHFNATAVAGRFTATATKKTTQQTAATTAAGIASSYFNATAVAGRFAAIVTATPQQAKAGIRLRLQPNQRRADDRCSKQYPSHILLHQHVLQRVN